MVAARFVALAPRSLLPDEYRTDTTAFPTRTAAKVVPPCHTGEVNTALTLSSPTLGPALATSLTVVGVPEVVVLNLAQTANSFRRLAMTFWASVPRNESITVSISSPQLSVKPVCAKDAGGPIPAPSVPTLVSSFLQAELVGVVAVDRGPNTSAESPTASGETLNPAGRSLVVRRTAFSWIPFFRPALGSAELGGAGLGAAVVEPGCPG